MERSSLVFGCEAPTSEACLMKGFVEPLQVVSFQWHLRYGCDNPSLLCPYAYLKATRFRP